MSFAEIENDTFNCVPQLISIHHELFHVFVHYTSLFLKRGLTFEAKRECTSRFVLHLLLLGKQT
jgi:hypothetical protein